MKLLNELQKTGKFYFLISAIISLLGLLVDDDVEEISTAEIIFEYMMMTLIIFSIIFTSAICIAYFRKVN
jgi:hypothetical protein